MAVVDQLTPLVELAELVVLEFLHVPFEYVSRCPGCQHVVDEPRSEGQFREAAGMVHHLGEAGREAVYRQLPRKINVERKARRLGQDSHQCLWVTSPYAIGQDLRLLGLKLERDLA